MWKTFTDEYTWYSEERSCLIMSRYRITLVSAMVLFFALLPLNGAGIENQTLSDPDDARTEINSDLSLAHHTAKEKVLNDLKELCTKNFKSIESEGHFMKPMDCSDIYLEGDRRDGLYYIWPKSRMSCGPLRVYCDMESDGGGWTVIQRRGDYGNPKDHFYREWSAYKAGFGDRLKEFWIGNDNIFALTNQRPYQLRVNLTAWEGDTAYAIYDEFWISDEVQNYTLYVNGYSGTAGNSLVRHSGMKFTTIDRDNDMNPKGNCASQYKGAWWYEDCITSDLNGMYLKGTNSDFGIGVVWGHFKGQYHSLRSTVMKIRPAGFKGM